MRLNDILFIIFFCNKFAYYVLLCISVLFENSRIMYPMSEYLKNSGIMLSGPVDLPSNMLFFM